VDTLCRLLGKKCEPWSTFFGCLSGTVTACHSVIDKQTAFGYSLLSPPYSSLHVLPPLLLDLLPLSSSSLAPPHHIYLLSFVYRLILLVLQSIYTYLEIKFDFWDPLCTLWQITGERKN